MSKLSKSVFSKTVHGVLALSLSSALVGAGPAYADEREMRHEHERHEMHERREAREPYRADHWIYDDRHHHNHYYPSIGYSIGVLPPGYLALRFGPRRLFFQAGVWYEPMGQGFVVVRPPIGAVVPMLPPAYATVYVGGVPYYYADDTYYVAVQGGFAVANPPAYVEAPVAPPNAPASPMAPPAPSALSTGGTWYYCAAAKAYYPYVTTCPSGWQAVPASAPPSR